MNTAIVNKAPVAAPPARAAATTSAEGPPSALEGRFFAPMRELLEFCPRRRRCSGVSDEEWMLAGIQRVLSGSSSGRAFARFFQCRTAVFSPGRTEFLRALKSPRRLGLCTEINARLCALAPTRPPDLLAGFPQLQDFELLAGEGDCPGPGLPNQVDDGNGLPGDRSYALDLRTRMLTHLGMTERNEWKQDQGTRMPGRRRTLYIWDRARDDFRHWSRLSRQDISFLALDDGAAASAACGLNAHDAADPPDASVQGDEIVEAPCGTPVRRLTVVDVPGAAARRFVTSETTIEPGLLVHLHGIRRGLDNRFQELSHKFGRNQAWATAATARAMQAQFICLTRNLLHHFEPGLLI